MRTDLDAADGCGRTAVRVELHVDGAPLLITSVSGTVAPLGAAGVRRALFTLPAMTAVIVARIHWHALKLWLRRVPFVPKPAPPAQAISRGTGGTAGSAFANHSPAGSARTGANTPTPSAAVSTPTPAASASAHNPT